jgi:hypothetical protein
MAPIPRFANINWEAIDQIDKDQMMKQVLSVIETPGDFWTNLWHFGHGATHFGLVAALVMLWFWMTWRLAGKNTIKAL